MIDYDKLKPIGSGESPRTPIVPEDGLYLFDPGIHHENALYQTPTRLTNKFVRAFRKVWGQLPESDRNTLKDYWQGRWRNHDTPKIAINLPCPHTVVPCKADCRGRGHELAFELRWIEWSTPSELAHLIAHELGHAISYPHGWMSQHKCETWDGLQQCVACECRAFSYMAAWGFDPFLETLPKGKTLMKRFASRRELAVCY